MFLSITSFGTFAARALSSAKRSFVLDLGSEPPPILIALMISFAQREKTFPFLASLRSFLCLIFAHLL